MTQPFGIAKVPGRIDDVNEPGIGTVEVLEGTKAGEQLPEGSIELPSGAIIVGAPSGLLDFLIGTMGHESSGDYQAEASDGGRGAYQFTDDDMSADAAKSDWSPFAQDVIAADQAIQYYHQFGGAKNPKVWEEVSQAWWGGPGASFIGDKTFTTQTDEGPVTEDDYSPDWPDIEQAQSGELAFGSYQFGPGFKGGLTPLQTVDELQGTVMPQSTGAKANVKGTTDTSSAAVTGAQISSLGSSLGSGLESAAVTDARNLLEMVGGVALIALGCWMLFKDLSGTAVGSAVGSTARSLTKASKAPKVVDKKLEDANTAEAEGRLQASRESRQRARDKAKLRSITGGQAKPYSEPFEGEDPEPGTLPKERYGTGPGGSGRRRSAA